MTGNTLRYTYRKLHDMLSDMIEGGRLKEEDIPDDYQALVEALAALAASQEKAEPVAWFTDDYLTDKSATTWDRSVAERWREKGWPVTPIYATPVAAHADMRECRHCGWMCAPNAAKSKRWYPLAEPVAAQAMELEYATSLAVHLHQRYYTDKAPNWKPFSDLRGVLSQIDNMISGLPAPVAAQASEPVCNLWVDPVTKRYEVDHCTHPTNELIPVFAAPQPSAEAVRDAAYEKAADVAMKAPITSGMADDKSAQALAFHASARIHALKSAPPQPAEQPTKTVTDCSTDDCQCDACCIERGEFAPHSDGEDWSAPAQPAEQPSAPMWVSVNDRLPPLDSDKRILVYTEGADFDGEQFFDIKADDLYPTPDGEDDTRTEVAACVTHWMERPVPRPAVNTKSASPTALTDEELASAKYLNTVSSPGYMHSRELTPISAWVQRQIASAQGGQPAPGAQEGA